MEHPTQRTLDRFETAAGNEIPNSQELTVIGIDEEKARRNSFALKYKGAIPRTTKPTSIYNCHGLVLGARRTGIEKDIREILKDDGYVQIQSETNTLAGDIVLYVSQGGEVDHSAILVKPGYESMSAQGLVVSKWGSFIEYVHDIPLCPYFSDANIEFWRLDERPRCSRQILSV
jgi:hypothetical protein